MGCSSTLKMTWENNKRNTETDEICLNWQRTPKRMTLQLDESEFKSKFCHLTSMCVFEGKLQNLSTLFYNLWNGDNTFVILLYMHKSICCIKAWYLVRESVQQVWGSSL